LKKTEINESMQELSFQQKIWKGTSVFLYSIRPLLLYSVLPALLMSIGMMFWSNRTAEQVVSGSGNFYFAAGIVLTMFLLYIRCKKNGCSLAVDATLEWKELDRKKLLWLAGCGFGFGFFFSALITVVPFPKALIESYSGASNSLTYGTDQILALVSTIILAPIAEEIVFRGFMLNRLLGWFQEKHSVLLVSVVFALFHISPIWIVYAFIMGLFLAKVSIDEDNIAYSIVLHMGFNLNVLPIWLINRNPKLETVLFANDLIIALYGVVSCLMAVWFLKKYRKETMKW